jgi:hypothetical protein
MVHRRVQHTRSQERQGAAGKASVMTSLIGAATTLAGCILHD